MQNVKVHIRPLYGYASRLEEILSLRLRVYIHKSPQRAVRLNGQRPHSSDDTRKPLGTGALTNPNCHTAVKDCSMYHSRQGKRKKARETEANKPESAPRGHK